MRQLAELAKLLMHPCQILLNYFVLSRESGSKIMIAYAKHSKTAFTKTEVTSQSSLRIDNVQSTASQIEGYMKQDLSEKVFTIGIFSN